MLLGATSVLKMVVSDMSKCCGTAAGCWECQRDEDGQGLLLGQKIRRVRFGDELSV